MLSESDKIRSFTEKVIRAKLLSKLDPSKINKDGKHWKAYLSLDGKIVGKYKIPNEHDREMHHSKSQFIAQSLHLKASEFNDLIECPLTGVAYYKLLKARVK